MIKLNKPNNKMNNKISLLFDDLDAINLGLLTHIMYIDDDIYIYDTISGEIIKIDYEFEELLKALSLKTKIARKNKLKKLIDKMSLNKVQGLLKKMISIQNKDKCLLPTPQKIDISIKNVSSKDLGFHTLILKITDKCNFRCIYCNNEETNKNRPNKIHIMSETTANKSIEYFINNTKYPSPMIVFFGGEPLLRKRFLINCIEYAHRLNSNIKFTIQTNGYYLDNDFFDFLKKNNVNIGISIDGPKSINDKNRPLKSGMGSLKIIMNNLEAIFNKDKNYLTNNCFIVLTLYNNKYISDIKDFFNKNPILRNLKLVISRINITKVRNSFSENIDIPISMKYLKNLFDEYEDVLLKGKWKLLNFQSAFFNPAMRSIDNRAPMDKINYFESLCPIGNWRLVVDANGEFGYCERAHYLQNIGNIRDGLSQEMINKVKTDFLLTTAPCHKCWAFRICNLCWIDIYNKKGKLDIFNKKIKCEEYKKNLSDFFYYYIKIIKQKPNAFDIIPIKYWKFK